MKYLHTMVRVGDIEKFLKRNAADRGAVLRMIQELRNLGHSQMCTLA